MKEPGMSTVPSSPQLFIVAGMPRGATTFLYHNLQRHPQIFLPARKEVNYFNVNHSLGPQWYRRQYASIQPGQVAGDISPPCFLDPLAPARIRVHDPGVKVLLVVRDPVEWALSFYAQFASFNYEMPDFANYLDGYDYRMQEGTLRVDFRDDAVIRSIERYREAFGANLLMYDFNFFRVHRLDVLRAIEAFLELPPFFADDNFDDLRINASSRRNWRPVSWLLSREWLIRGVQACLPHRLVLACRGHFDRFSAAGRGEYQHPERHVALACDALESQRAAIRELFASGPIQLGDGRPFSAEQTSPGGVPAQHLTTGVYA
jgi:hypothetical protein